MSQSGHLPIQAAHWGSSEMLHEAVPTMKVRPALRMIGAHQE